MRHIVIAILALAACHSEPRNLAADFVHEQEPDAKCKSYYRADGPTLVHSVSCKLPNKVQVYCWTSTDKPPQCAGVGGDQKQAEVPKPAEAPASATNKMPEPAKP